MILKLKFKKFVSSTKSDAKTIAESPRMREIFAMVKNSHILRWWKQNTFQINVSINANSGKKYRHTYLL